MNQELQLEESLKTELGKVCSRLGRDAMLEQINLAFPKKAGRPKGLLLPVNMTIRFSRAAKERLQEEALRKGVKLSHLIRERLSV
jgi:hypothetical protein